MSNFKNFDLFTGEIHLESTYILFKFWLLISEINNDDIDDNNNDDNALCCQQCVSAVIKMRVQLPRCRIFLGFIRKLFNSSVHWFVFFMRYFCFQDNYFDLRKLLEKSKKIFADKKAVQLSRMRVQLAGCDKW